MEKIKAVKWTENAIKSLQEIYLFHYDDSPETAESIVNEIVTKASQIIFPNQYQKDDINPDYRRIIVKSYKML